MVRRAALGLGLLFACAQARTHKVPAPDANQNGFPVIAHLALKDKSPCRVITAEQWRKRYLYLDHLQTANLTVLDVTNPAQPRVAREINRGGIGGEVRLMSGDAGLVTFPVVETAPKTISIVSFADPRSPRLERTFNNIAGFAQASARGLIFIVNDEGLWILQRQPGPDVELEKEYERQVLYGH